MMERKQNNKSRSSWTTPWLFFVYCWILSVVRAEESSTNDASEEIIVPPTPEAKKPLDFDLTNTDWGSYYDPQNIFCGKFDCYKILGFDYESFGTVKPDTKEITKRFRKLSREWHPDKNKRKDAKERFVKIKRAHEVLTKATLRKEYDELRYDQEAYFRKYGTSVLWSYAPKSDTTIVILALFVLANVASWYIQKHRWQMVADRLIKATVEDWSPSQGGTPESKHLREDALARISEQEKDQPADASAENSTKSGKKKKQKLSLKEKKQMEQEALLPIVTDLVNEMKDFGGGFHQPTWEDLLIVGMVRAPYKVVIGTIWQMKYWARRLQKNELNDEEREVLTSRAVGPVIWDIATEEDRQSMIKRELWIKENLLEWKEEQEIKKLSAAEQKQYNKLKKKGKLE